MTTRVKSATSGRRYLCRFIPCGGDEETNYLLHEAQRIQVSEVDGKYKYICSSFFYSSASSFPLPPNKAGSCWSGKRAKQRKRRFISSHSDPLVSYWIRKIYAFLTVQAILSEEMSSVRNVDSIVILWTSKQDHCSPFTDRARRFQNRSWAH